MLGRDIMKPVLKFLNHFNKFGGIILHSTSFGKPENKLKKMINIIVDTLSFSKISKTLNIFDSTENTEAISQESND